MKKTQPKKPRNLETVEVETVIRHAWDCPECGLQHEEVNTVKQGDTLTCTAEFKQEGCGKKFKAQPF